MHIHYSELLEQLPNLHATLVSLIADLSLEKVRNPTLISSAQKILDQIDALCTLLGVSCEGGSRFPEPFVDNITNDCESNISDFNPQSLSWESFDYQFGLRPIDPLGIKESEE